jgi:hypothetical protein
MLSGATNRLGRAVQTGQHRVLNRSGEKLVKKFVAIDKISTATAAPVRGTRIPFDLAYWMSLNQ